MKSLTGEERERIVARWGYRHCVHPYFVDVEPPNGARACGQCGELLNEIVDESAHPESIIQPIRSLVNGLPEESE